MITKTFTEIKDSDSRLKKLTLTISSNENADAHINGTEVIISSKYEKETEKEKEKEKENKQILQYLISHELGHYLCKHHILFNLLVFGTIPVLAVIALVLTNYVINKPFSHAIAPMLGIWFVIVLVYLTIKECTLFFEYQADAAGQRLLEKIEPGAYRAGLKSIYANRISEATDNKEKGKLQKRSKAKLDKLPIS